MNRYLDSDATLETVFAETLNSEFAWLDTVKFKLLFDTKKRISKGKVTLASVELANEKVKFFTTDEGVPEGYDCIMIVDAVAWQYATDKDKKRIISHELNHVVFNEKGKIKLVGHDVEDFAAELVKNADDPNWGSKLAELTLAIYDQQEDMQEGQQDNGEGEEVL